MIELAEDDQTTVSINGGEPFPVGDQDAMDRELGKVLEKHFTSTTFLETKKIVVEVDLTDTEKAERAIAAAVVEEEIRADESILADLKMQEKAIKGRIEEKLADVRRDLRAIARGTESRDFECGVVNDFKTNRVGYISVETGECMKVRAMTAEERQLVIGGFTSEPAPGHLALMDEWETDNPSDGEGEDAGPECVEVDGDEAQG